MTFDTAEKAVDIALCSPAECISIEFQGGEPLINFGTLSHIVEYCEQKNCEKKISFNLVSNLSLLTEDIADFLVLHNIQVSVSLDGNMEVHNCNRKFRSGNGSYEATIKGIELLRRKGCRVSAIQTTTRYSLGFYKEIIDTYVELGFESIFIRPLTRLGYAKENWENIGYTSEEFVEFYKKALMYIIELNISGKRIVEGHASIFLSKIMHGYSSNYMELRSPCGAAIGQMAFYYDGDIYSCDEGRMVAEMGDTAFRMGNVFENNYNDLVESSVCKTLCLSSCLESIPGCCDCAYQPYCGACPVINYALENDLFAKTCYHYRCRVYSGMLDILFSIIHESNEDKVAVISRWGE